MHLDRRELLATSAIAGTGLARSGAEPFHLDFAPHLGMFRHHAGDDPADQIAFMADQGFRAMEDNGLAGRDTKTQDKIRQALDRHGMRMGVFVAHAEFQRVSFASDDAAMRERILADVRKAVEVAQRVQARWCTVVPGAYDKGREWDYQTANVVDNLRRAAEVCEASGLVMVLEPLNWWSDHAGVFLTKVPQAYLICRAVRSPSCKILFDMYHQQISEGNLLRNIERAWDEVAYFQIGDNPGRCEPGTGEINYKNVFRHLRNKGYAGILGMEHGKSRPGKEGELALLEAYRSADPV
ncbi:MAG: TIM barrel protein [Planctomycetota bacterium]